MSSLHPATDVRQFETMAEEAAAVAGQITTGLMNSQRPKRTATVLAALMVFVCCYIYVLNMTSSIIFHVSHNGSAARVVKLTAKPPTENMSTLGCE